MLVTFSLALLLRTKSKSADEDLNVDRCFTALSSCIGPESEQSHNAEADSSAIRSFAAGHLTLAITSLADAAPFRRAQA